ncbi:solute carrier family 66 member 2 isoform X1 [Bacillus rossius redtenbacheri]|uniref:solute carrier family 66 member 2 isoform X1 n=1 Tax=Bacillus rossius redtenbacheri TaxID=93214 RepID=UPI002FDEB38C
MENIFEDITLPRIVKWISAAAMIFGGIIPYIPQYREIKRTENAEGFSLFVCLALLIANTLRILFWFGEQYELPLLIQSFLMNVTMFAMIHLCVGVRNRTQIIRGRDRVFTEHMRTDSVDGVTLHLRSNKETYSPGHVFTDFDKRYFWAWTDFMSYVDFMLLFAIFSSVIMYLFIENNLFVQTVGFLAVLTEALLGAPQLTRNFRKKSTEGMSIKMVVMWTLGDTFKTTYFIVSEVPMQFWLCGCLQIGIDAVILFQVYLYRHNTGARVKKQDIVD